MWLNIFFVRFLFQFRLRKLKAEKEQRQASASAGASVQVFWNEFSRYTPISGYSLDLISQEYHKKSQLPMTSKIHSLSKSLRRWCQKLRTQLFHLPPQPSKKDPNIRIRKVKEKLQKKHLPTPPRKLHQMLIPMRRTRRKNGCWWLFSEHHFWLFDPTYIYGCHALGWRRGALRYKTESTGHKTGKKSGQRKG